MGFRNKVLLCLSLMGFMCLSLFGCGKKSYNVDYCGQMDMFQGAQNSYKEGTKVELVYDFIATDTDYSFYVDGESANCKWDDKRGFVITFIMPSHDIEVYCEEKNTMENEYDPDGEEGPFGYTDEKETDIPESDNMAVVLDGLTLVWADEKKTDLSDYEEIDISDGDYKTGILFTALGDVSEFKFYELTITDVSSDGILTFNRNKIYGPEDIFVETPVIFNVEFQGDMSAFGFSYEYNGLEKYYSIMVSGKDGSLIVEEIDPGYPDENVTIPFTKESEFHPEYFDDLVKSGMFDESEIDNCLEGISDMLYVYQGEYDSTEYECAYGYNVSQEFFQDSYYGTRITHTIAWTGDELLDPVMKKVGYKEYEVNYYYPFGAWITAGERDVKPVYASLYIDGNGFEYYFADNELIMRSGPDGETYNPKANDFITNIFKIGCYYGNNLLGERGRYNLAISSLDGIEKRNNAFVLSGSIMDRNCSGSFVIDEDTLFDDEFDEIGFQGLKKDESFYSWYSRVYDAIDKEEDWVEASALLGIWDIKTTNNHVDSVCGTYWWD